LVAGDGPEAGALGPAGSGHLGEELDGSLAAQGGERRVPMLVARQPEVDRGQVDVVERNRRMRAHACIVGGVSARVKERKESGAAREENSYNAQTGEALDLDEPAGPARGAPRKRPGLHRLRLRSRRPRPADGLLHRGSQGPGWSRMTAGGPARER